MASSEHMCYFGNALDCCPILHLQDYLQSNFPILSRTIFFYLVFVVLGVLIPILGSTEFCKVYLNLLHCAITSPALWVALITLTISS